MENDYIVCPTFNRIVKVWWSYTWRVMVFGAVVGFPAGMIFEAYKTDEIIRSLLIYFLMMLISIYVMEVILKKNYGDFKICLVKSTGFAGGKRAEHDPR